jgi:hypothetical protein
MLTLVPGDDEREREVRARARTARMLGAAQEQGAPTTPEQRVSLVAELARAAWAFSGQPWPSYARANIPVRVIRR